MLGTVVNALAVVAGSGIGLIARKRLDERYSTIITSAMGLVTIVVGVSMALKSESLIMVVVSLVAGSLIGEFCAIEAKINRLAGCLQRKKGEQNSQATISTESENRFVEGLVSSTLLFCVGSMSILGAIEDASGAQPTILLTKSVMDGSVAIFFAASLGISVMLSAIPLLLYQGLITLCAGWIIVYLPSDVMADLTSTGGILLIGLGISILKLRHISVVNMLPALIIVVVLSYFF